MDPRLQTIVKKYMRTSSEIGQVWTKRVQALRRAVSGSERERIKGVWVKKGMWDTYCATRMGETVMMRIRDASSFL
jgi:hypothetical protein